MQCGFCTPGLVVAVHDLLQRVPAAGRRHRARGARRQPVPLHRLREDPGRRAAGGRADRVHERRARHRGRDGRARSTPPAPSTRSATSWSTATGSPRSVPGRHRTTYAGTPTASSTRPAACSRPAWSTPTSTSTSGRPAAWPSTRRCSSGSPRSTRCGPASTRRSCVPPSAAALGWLARTGCTTTTDHHYVFPRGGGDLLAAEIEAAAAVGLRFHPTRGSMDLGRQPGRPAAGLGGRGPRRDPRRDRVGDHAVPRPVARRDGAGRGRAVLAVLGDRRS